MVTMINCKFATNFIMVRSWLMIHRALRPNMGRNYVANMINLRYKRLVTHK